MIYVFTTFKRMHDPASLKIDVSISTAVSILDTFFCHYLILFATKQSCVIKLDIWLSFQRNLSCSSVGVIMLFLSGFTFESLYEKAIVQAMGR